jgi:hypothetical protein
MSVLLSSEREQGPGIVVAALRRQFRADVGAQREKRRPDGSLEQLCGAGAVRGALRPGAAGSVKGPRGVRFLGAGENFFTFRSR